MWNDLNNNDGLDAGEPGLAGWTVYVDLNKTGKLDAGDPAATTETDGSYSLQVLRPANAYQPVRGPRGAAA